LTRRTKQSPTAVLLAEFHVLPVAIVAHDFIDSARANFIADGTQFGAVGKDRIFECSLLVVVPFTIGITGFRALPLFMAEDVGHAHRRKFVTKRKRLGKSPYDLSEPINV
jgi:hypothetical protein